MSIPEYNYFRDEAEKFAAAWKNKDALFVAELTALLVRIATESGEEGYTVGLTDAGFLCHGGPREF